MKKKFTIIIYMMLVLLSLQGMTTQTAHAANDNKVVRVKLSIGSPSEYSFYVDGNYSVNGIGLERQQYTVRASGEGLVLDDGTSVISSGSSIKIVQHAPTTGSNNYLSLYNTRYNENCNYLGNMEFINNSGSILAVNHVYIEYYLYGVVPYEMSDSWPKEALKAQAVAARTYALMDMRSSGAYDIGDTSSDQVYKGYNPSYTNTINAVNETAGQAVTYEDAIFRTYFGASNGGYTEIPLHTWSGGTDVPYYQIREDAFDVANPSSLYETIFFPTLIDADHPIMTNDNVSGTPNIGNAVVYIKSAIIWSKQLEGYGVDSLDDFELTGVISLVSHTPDGVYNCRLTEHSDIQCMDYIGATGNFSVKLKEDGTTTTVENIVLDLRYFDGSEVGDTYKVFNKDSLRLFVVKPEDGGYSISQKRYGHGCGLSQRGAQQRASSGHSYQDILVFYYPETLLTTLSYSAPVLTPFSSMYASIKYQTHVQNIGWQEWKRNGEVSGTSGQSLRLEGIRIDLEGLDNSIEYRTHVQNIGWQDWVSEGRMAGTTGKSLRLEAIEIRLKGQAAKDYDVYYRVHAQNFGWMDWAKNGQSAGSAGYSYRLEAIEIKLVKKGGAAPGSTSIPFRDLNETPPTKPVSVKYQTHVQDIGWQGWKSDGEVAGTRGQSRRLEGMYIKLDGADGIEYRTHVQDIGWQDWVGEGQMTGTSGRSLRLEAIDIRLTADMAKQYDIYYRVHAQNVGWMDWAKNGQSAGTAGYSYRLEAIEIVLVVKGGSAPGSTARPYISR